MTFQWPFDSGRGVMSYFAGGLFLLKKYVRSVFSRVS